jgi:hypothetical protein
MDANNTPVVVAAGPEDMIAAAWFNLGYKPRDSLVLLGLEGPRHRLGVLVRADLPRSRPAEPSPIPPRPLDRLPPDEQREIVPEMVRDLLATVAATGAAGVLAIVVDERALDQARPAVYRTLRHETRALGLHLVDVLGVTSTAFGSLKCRDPRCCPPGGRPIDLVMSSRAAAVHVVNGETVAESETELLADVTPEPAGSPEAMGGDQGPRPAAWPRPYDPRRPRPEDPADRTSGKWRVHWWQRWQQACVDAAAVPARGEPIHGLSRALHEWHLRDAVLMDLLGASDREVQEMLAGTYNWRAQSLLGPKGDEFGGRRAAGTRAATGENSGSDPGAPEWMSDLGRLLRQPPRDDRLRAGQTVLAAAARVAAEGDRAPALALLALLSWFEGRGGRARLLLERALDDAPSVSLAALVDDLLLRRVPPPWLREGA